MPSVSKNQQVAAAIAEHAPDKLYARNRGLLNMKRMSLHHFASTPRKGLPKSAPKSKGIKTGFLRHSK